MLQSAEVTAPVSMQGVNRRIGAMQRRCNAADVMTSCCAPSCCEWRGIGIATETQRRRSGCVWHARASVCTATSITAGFHSGIVALCVGWAEASAGCVRVRWHLTHCDTCEASDAVTECAQACAVDAADDSLLVFEKLLCWKN